MATQVLRVSDRLPAGTTVNAYPLSQFQAGQLPWSGALPSGVSSAGSAVVAADGSLTITGLADGTPYYAYAASPDRYVLFTTKDVGSASSSDSLTTTGTATTPAALAVLTVITAPPPGTYKVRAMITLTGTAETQLANLRLRQNGVVIGTLPSLTASSGVGTSYDFDRVTLTTGNIDLQVIALATTGAIYNCTLVATRVA